MAISIKDEETTDLIRRLAELTGDTLTGATRHAVEERLERLERDASTEARYERIMAIASEMRERLGDEPLSTDELYDEDGLPA